MDKALEAYQEAGFGLEFFYLVLENIPSKVYVKNTEGRIVYANQSARDFFPPDRQGEVIGLKLLDEFEPGQQKGIREAEEKALTEDHAEGIFDVTDSLGQMFTFRIKKKWFTSATGERLLLSIASDITKMAKRGRDLVESNTQLGQFAAVAAHDLRSPLSTYGGLLYLIQNDPESSLSPTAQDYLERMLASTEQLKNNISGLLNAYKADHSHQITRRPTDLQAIFEEVRFNLEDAINRSQATVTSDNLPTLEVDLELMRHLFHNLIENSIKYKGSERPIISLTYELRPGAHYFCLEDNGIGMPKGKAHDVFAPFDQGGRSATGIGLGLSLCQKVIELHSGRVWIDESYKDGCRICFTLPL